MVVPVLLRAPNLNYPEPVEVPWFQLFFTSVFFLYQAKLEIFDLPVVGYFGFGFSDALLLLLFIEVVDFCNLENLLPAQTDALPVCAQEGFEFVFLMGPVIDSFGLSGFLGYVLFWFMTFLSLFCYMFFPRIDPRTLDGLDKGLTSNDTLIPAKVFM